MRIAEKVRMRIVPSCLRSHSILISPPAVIAISEMARSLMKTRPSSWVRETSGMVLTIHSGKPSLGMSAQQEGPTMRPKRR